MAATILSGTGNVSWTNNTGGNVRVVINYFGANAAESLTNGQGISMNAGGAVISASLVKAFGKNLAFSGGFLSGTHPSQTYQSFGMIVPSGSGFTSQALPTEVYIPHTRSITLALAGGTASYNILIIPEDG